MRVKKQLGLVSGMVLGVMACAVTHAQDEITYSYLSAGYGLTEVEFEGIDVDGDGFGFGGSVEFGQSPIFGFASLQQIDYDFDIGVRQLEIGIGAHTPISERTSLFGTVSYVKLDGEDAAEGIDPDGVGFGLGLRHLVSDRLELNGGAKLVRLEFEGESDTSTSLFVGGQYHVTDQLGISASFSAGEDDERTFIIGGRYNFATR